MNTPTQPTAAQPTAAQAKPPGRSALRAQAERTDQKELAAAADLPLHGARRVVIERVTPNVDGGRRVIFVSGNDPKANSVVANLIERLDFAPIILGELGKGGLLQLTRCLAIELAPHNIQVNSLAPGWTATDMTDWIRNDPKYAALKDEMILRTPAGRFADKADEPCPDGKTDCHPSFGLPPNVANAINNFTVATLENVASGTCGQPFVVPRDAGPADAADGGGK